MNPITLALLGILGYRTYYGKGRLAEWLGRTGPGQAQGQAQTPPEGAPQGAVPAATGMGGAQDINAMLDRVGGPIAQGLTDLFKDFQEKGLGDTIKSWVEKGPNQPVSSADVEKVLGAEKIDWLVKETGLPREKLLEGLSRELPQTVDKLTPEGHLPTEEEMRRTRPAA